MSTPGATPEVENQREAHAGLELAGLVALVALAGAWRMWLVWNRLVIDTDGAHYGNLARHAIENGWRAALDPAWPPLFPWLAALAARTADAASLPQAVAQGGYLVSALAGTALLPVAWWLARRWFGARTAFVSTLLLAFHPEAMRYSASMMSESLFALLFLCAFTAVEWADTGGRRGAGHVLAGVACALAVVTRPEGWGLALALGLGRVFAGSVGTRARLRAALLFGVPLLLVGAPWLLYLQAELGTLGPGAKGPYNFHLAHEELYLEHGIDVQHGDVKSLRGPNAPFVTGDYRVREVLEAAPGPVLGAALWTGARALFDKLPSLLGWPLVPFALIGLVTRRRARRPWPPGAKRLLLLLALWLAMLMPFFTLQRFFLGFLPFLTLAAALGIEGLLRRIEDIRRRRTSELAVVALAVLLMLVDTAGDRHGEDGAPLYVEAGAALRERGAGDALVLAGVKPEPAFYAGAEYRRLHVDDPALVLAEARAAGATHLLLDDRHTPPLLPSLLAWLEPGAEPEELRDRLELRDEHQRLVLWRIGPAR